MQKTLSIPDFPADASSDRWRVGISTYYFSDRPCQRRYATKLHRQIFSAVIFLFSFIFLPTTSWAQNETNFALPPLDTLIELALARSAKLQSQDVWIKTQLKEWQLEKKSWVDVISVGGTALYGNNTLLDNQQSDIGRQQVTTDRRSTIYNGGLIVRFTLGDVLNSDEKAQLKQLEYEQSVIDRRILEREIKEEVMVRYDRFLSNQRLLKLEADNVEALHLSYEMARKYYEEGNYLTSEYSTILSRYIAAQKQLEERTMEVRHQYRMLLSIAGLN